MWETIVVGTDGSETAQRAVAEARRIAEQTGGKVHVVCAYASAHLSLPKEGSEVFEILPDTKGRAVVEQAAARLRGSGVQVKGHAMPGDAAEALLEVAEQEKADLIVVGSNGMRGVRRVLGSVPNKVSHQARCSVLIVATEDRA
jgi:nucleotide-binding universal stress UspA family protein